MRLCILIDKENEVYAYAPCHEVVKDKKKAFIHSLMLDEESRALGCKMVIIDETQIPEHELGDCYYDFEEQDFTKKLKYSQKKAKWREIENLRFLRAQAFEIGDKYQLPHLWNSLTEQQQNEYNEWRQAWLDVTETKAIPEQPTWMN